MSLRVLGCSGAIAQGRRTTAFLLGTHTLIDAGTGVGDLTLDELGQIDHILLTHAHFDHVAALPLLADAVMRRRARAGAPPIQVYALAQTITTLQTNVFNGALWPDFSALPTLEAPTLRFTAVAVGDVLTLPGGVSVEVLPARHTVPTVGYAFGDTAFSGDTGPNPELWSALARRSQHTPLRHLILECAFADEDQQLAKRSAHHCPSSLMGELVDGLAQLPTHPALWITHLKAGEEAAVQAQLAGHVCHTLKVGDVIETSFVTSGAQVVWAK